MKTPLVQNIEYQVLQGDCLEVLPGLAAESVDAIVTDPPYGLSDHSTKDLTECLLAWIAGARYEATGAGFMGKKWDVWVPGPEVWRECYRVLKPGGHVLCFAGTRTQDLMGIALRLAGFEIRDQVQWLFGSGFPKSLNVSKAVERQDITDAERQDITDAERQFCEWLRDESGLSVADVGTDRYHEQRIEVVNTATKEAPRWGRRALVPTFDAWQKLKGLMMAYPPEWVEQLVKNPPTPPITHPGQWERGKGEGTAGENEFRGFGTALKPAHEPIIVARKPLQGTVAANVVKWGTGAINVDGCRVAGASDDVNNRPNKGNGNAKDGSMFGASGMGAWSSNNGRWPANVAHDGSEEVLRLFPNTGKSAGGGGKKTPGKHGIYGAFNGHQYDDDLGYGDTGSAARFFYCAKASKADRDEGLDGHNPRQRDDSRKQGAPGGDNPRNRGAAPRANHHPTVKPTALMRWLVRLVTPPGGVVLDPFTGSGSTGKAAMLEGVRFIGIEQDAEYCEIARARIGYAVADKAFGLFDLPEYDDRAMAAD